LGSFSAAPPQIAKSRVSRRQKAKLPLSPADRYSFAPEQTKPNHQAKKKKNSLRTITPTPGVIELSQVILRPTEILALRRTSTFLVSAHHPSRNYNHRTSPLDSLDPARLGQIPILSPLPARSKLDHEKTRPSWRWLPKKTIGRVLVLDARALVCPAILPPCVSAVARATAAMLVPASSTE
jgi:hypothetical protein